MSIGSIGIGRIGITPLPSPSPASYPSGTFPPLSGILNVKDYGAKGDGVTDDTAAILAAIAQIPPYVPSLAYQTSIVYFPNGTYIISDRIQRLVPGTWVAFGTAGYQPNLVLMGQSRAGTIIKLANGAAAYGDVNNPKAMIFTTSGLQFNSDPNNGGRHYLTLGEGNEAFNNSLENLTIDVGIGNPGAIALDYLGNNECVVRNLTIQASDPAYMAISMRRFWNGPLLMSHVDINVAGAGSWQYGIDVFCTTVSLTLEYININGTLLYGLRNTQNAISMRKVNINTLAGFGIANVDPGATNPSVGIAAPQGPLEGLISSLDCSVTGTGYYPSVNVASANHTNLRVINYLQTFQNANGGTNVFSDTLGSSQSWAAAGADLRSVIAAANLVPALPGQDHIQLTVQFAAGTVGASIDGMYVGESGGAQPYDFDGNQVPVTFGGNLTVTGINGPATFVSDKIPFTYSPAAALVVAMHVHGTTVNGAWDGGSTGNNNYWNNSTSNQTANTSITVGHSQGGISFVSLASICPASAPVGPVTLNQTITGAYHGTTLVGTTAWQLAVSDPPPLPSSVNGVWAVAPHGATDSTQELNDAFGPNAGSGVVCLQNVTNYRYFISGPILVGDNIDVIEGCYSVIQCNNQQSLAPYAIFKTSLTRTKPLFIRHLVAFNLTTTGLLGMVEHAGPCTIVCQDFSGLGIGFMTRDSAGGPVYGENIAATHLFTSGSAPIWIRNFNPEPNSLKVTNAGTPLWMLGWKTEQPTTNANSPNELQQTAGSVTEIVGGFFFPGGGPPGFAIQNTDGIVRGSFVVQVATFSPPGFYFPILLENTISGVTTLYGSNSYPQRGSAAGITAVNFDSSTPPSVSSVFTNAAVPTITGAATFYTVRGTTYFPSMTALPGSWNITGGAEGYALPTSYIYQWYRNGTPIGGAGGTVANTIGINFQYTIQAADESTTLTIGIKAVNAIGNSTEAISAGFSVGTPTVLDPTAITGMQLWLDPSDPSTYTQVSGAVSVINDISGNANSATQATAGQRPVVQVAAQNGLNTFRFTAASNQQMTITTPVSVDSAYTIIGVMRAGGPSGAGAVAAFGAAGANNTRGLEISGGILRTANSINYARGAVTNSDGNFHVYGMTLTGSTATQSIDGVSTAPTILPIPGTATFDTIGKGSIGVVMNGDFAEVMIYNNVISSPNETALINYLIGKWNA